MRLLQYNREALSTFSGGEFGTEERARLAVTPYLHKQSNLRACTLARQLLQILCFFVRILQDCLYLSTTKYRRCDGNWKSAHDIVSSCLQYWNSIIGKWERCVPSAECEKSEPLQNSIKNPLLHFRQTSVASMNMLRSSFLQDCIDFTRFINWPTTTTSQNRRERTQHNRAQWTLPAFLLRISLILLWMTRRLWILQWTAHRLRWFFPALPLPSKRLAPLPNVATVLRTNTAREQAPNDGARILLLIRTSSFLLPEPAAGRRVLLSWEKNYCLAPFRHPNESFPVTIRIQSQSSRYAVAQWYDYPNRYHWGAREWLLPPHNSYFSENASSAVSLTVRF